MNFSCSNQDACPVILDSKCVIYEGENLLYIGVNTNDNYRTALQNINDVIGNLILTGGITELTGDVIAVGPGITTATLATVNSTPGQYGSSTAIPKLTVDGKGRVTAITTEGVFIPSGALSFIGDVTGTGNTGSNTTLTLATVNSNVYTTNNFLKFAVNGKGLVTSATPVVSSDITTALGYTPYDAANPANYISRLDLSAIAPLGYNNTNGQFSIQQADATHNGYISSTDWNTFNNKQAAGNYITDLNGEATAAGPGVASVTLNNAAVTGKVLTGLNITGGSVDAADSILTAFGKVQNQINGLIGGSIYQGTWNASTNTPALASGVGTKGHYYIVNVAGSTNLDGITDWNLGDWAIYDGTAWQQVDNTDAVVSVNGFTGAVSLTTDNISEGLTNQYFTTSRARLALSGGTGISYDNVTGVITNSLDLSGYVPYTGATTNVNLGVYGLTAGSATFGGIVTINATGNQARALYMQTGTDGSHYISGTGVNLFSEATDNLTMLFTTASTTKKVILNGADITSAKTYTLPNASGTLALTSDIPSLANYVTLNGTQTITGVKTFDAGLSLKDAVYPTPLSGYSSIGANPFGISIVTNQSSTIYRSDLGFPAAQRTYTFPNADGTIALTSNLSSYVPYTGAITNVDLGTWRLTANGLNIESSGALNIRQANSRSLWSGAAYTSIYADTSYGMVFYYSNDARNFTLSASALTASSSRTYTLPDASGTLALTSQIPSLSGTTNYVSKFTSSSNIGNSSIYDSGSAVTIGATNGVRVLTVSSATADNHVAVVGTAPSVSLSDLVAGAAYQAKFGLATSNGQFAPGSIAGDFVITSQTAGILFNTNSNTLALKLAGSGAATFASSVTATSLIRSGGTASQILAADGSVITAGTGISISGGTISSTSSSGVSSFNTRTGAITLVTGDVTSALGYTPYNSTNPSGYITSSGSISGNAATATNSSQLNGISSTQIFNNMGQNHNTQTNFDSISDFGFRYVQGTTNGPGTGSGQFYGMSLGLGNDYAYSSYALQLAIPRFYSSDKYISFRAREGGSWGSWVKVSAGYADSAGSAPQLTGPAYTNGSDGWFRSTGSTGWYNATYAGGIYMIDSTWVRTYNGKYLYVDSYIACGGDITAYYSDERLKKDIVKIDSALAKIMALDGVYYTPNDFAMEQKVERKQDRKVGVIAQTVQKVLPEVVSIAAFDLDENLESKSGENYLTVKYDKLVPVLIEAIKEQQVQIEELKSTINGFTR